MAIPLDQFVSRLADSGLITVADVQAFMDSLPAGERPHDAEQVLQTLVQKKRLTTWQARQIGGGHLQGLVLGNYVILDKLGQGGMGEVFKAQHTRMQRVVALKLLSPKVTSNPDALKRFQREVVAAARLVHPNVVTAYDADEAKGAHFLVMEHVAGRNLFQLIRETGVLSVAQALRCILQAARGLEYAHQQGVVHRDVKPSNLLLDASGVVKVLDLGLAGLTSADGASHDLTATGDILGTVDFMAPEQAENSKSADARSDVYSLGMSLWFLLTGRPGYERESLASKIMAHRTEPVPSLREARPEVSTELDEVFHKLVAKDPRDRYQTMTQVIAALEGCLADAGSSNQTSGDDNELAVRLSSISQREAEETVVFVQPLAESTQRLQALESTVQLHPKGPTFERDAIERSRRPIIVALAFLAGAALIMLTVFLLGPFRGDNVLIEVTDPDVELVIDNGAVKIVGAARRKVKLPAGEHELAVRRGEAELAQTFTIDKGQSTTLEVEVIDGLLKVKQDGQVLGQVALAKPKGTAPALPDGKYMLEFAPGSKVQVGTLKLDRNGALTLEAFVTTAEEAGGKPGVLLGTPQQFALHLDPQTHRLSLESNHEDGEHRVGPLEIAPGRRLHLAAVRTASEHRLYVEGILVGMAKIASPLVEANEPFTMGGEFAGTLADVRVSTTARYDEPFAPAERLETDDDTLALFQGSSGEDESLADISGHEHHGKIAGAKWVRINPAVEVESTSLQVRDLLQGLETAKDGLFHDPIDNTWKPGQWQLTLAGLKSGRARRELFRLPIESLPTSYSLLVEFGPVEVEGALLVALEVGPAHCYLVLNGDVIGEQRQAGFGEVDGIGNHKNETTALHVPCPLNEKHTLQLDAKTSGDQAELIALLDGQRVTGFKGHINRLAVGGAVKLYDGKWPALAIGSMQGNYRFHRVELRSTAPVRLTSAARDREVAAWIMERGGSVTAQHVADRHWQDYRPGNDLPRDAFFLRSAYLNGVKDVSSDDLVHLRGADRLRDLQLSSTAIDKGAVRHLMRLPSLRCLNVSQTKLTTASLAPLAELKALNQLGLSPEQIDDQRAFIKRLPELRRLELTATTDADLAKFTDIAKLREIHLPYQESVDEAVVSALQEGAPHCRVVVGEGEKAKVLGKDTVLDAVLELRKRGLLFQGFLYHRFDPQPLTDEMLASGQAWRFDRVEVPAEVTLTDHERELLLRAISAGRYVNISRQPRADEFARRLAENSHLEHIQLSDCDLTDVGLASLHGLSPVHYLGVTKTRVSRTGIDVLRAAMPGAVVDSDFGGLQPSFDPPAPRRALAPFTLAQAKEHQAAWARYLGVPVEYTNTIGMKFRLIPPGEFMMGSTKAEIDAALLVVGEDRNWKEHILSEGPQHKVILTQPLYLGVHEVTQSQFQNVMGRNPSFYSVNGPGKDAVIGLDTSLHPVEMASWNDVAEFCVKLSEQEKLKPFYSLADKTVTMLEGTGYRLPTEAEWEFSCRAGTTTKYWIGDKDEDLPAAGWFNVNSRGRTHAVGELKANPLGLYDVHGNVWELVQDSWEPTYYGQFQEQPAVNPNGSSPASAPHVFRGGNWYGPASGCRASYRNATGPAPRFRNIGFRVALTVDAVKQQIAKPSEANLSKFALEFDGVDDYVEIPTLKLRVDQPFTVEGIVHPSSQKAIPADDAKENYDPLFALNGPYDPQGPFLAVIFDRPNSGWWVGRGVQDTSKIHSIYKAGKELFEGPYHIAVTFEGTELQLYQRGQKVAFGTRLSPLPPETNVKDVPPLVPTIGWVFYRALGKHRYFRGEIREFRISTVSRYKDNFSPPKRMSSDADTLLLYEFNEGQGSSLKDASGNAHHGKIEGAKWVKVESGPK